MGGIEERWDDPSKPAELLGSAEEWHHVRPSSGRWEREERLSLLHSLSRGVQRIQPIITFIFSPNFVGLETQAMQQSEMPLCFSNFETKQKNRDTPRFPLKNRDEWQVCLYSFKVCWVLAKIFVPSFRLDLAVLTFVAVIKGYPIKNIPKNDVFVLFLPHVFMQVRVK